MSPQAKNAYEEGQYDPYKADVFSLGLILLEMATLVKPADLNPAEQVDVFVGRRLSKLRVSREFKELLRLMLSEIECKRPSMEAVWKIAKELMVREQNRLLFAEDERRVSVIATVQQPLAHVEPNTVKVFNFHKKAWEVVPLASAISVDEGSRYIWVAGQLFCSGGKGEGKGQGEAYLLGREGVVTKLANMLLPRFGHGLWWHSAKQSVLTFGGTPYPGTSTVYAEVSTVQRFGTSYPGSNPYPELRECEEFRLSLDTWQELPSMKEGRCHFNPCEYSDLLYLCGHPSNTIEAFNPDSGAFLPWQARLPESYSACLLLVHNDQLLIVSEHYVSQWIQEDDRLVQVSAMEHFQLDVCCSTNPAVDSRNGFFYMSLNGTCLKVKLDCTEWREVGV